MTEYDPDMAELRKRIDHVHHATPGAVDAPADLWQRVRSQVQSETEEKPTMSSIAMPASPVVTASPLSVGKPGGFRHYASLAATIAVVFSVALAGWFATMQLNQPDGRFALVGQSDQSDSCEVEPMTVEEALATVEHPFGDDFQGEPYPEWWQEEQLRRVLWVSDAPLMPHNYVDQALIDSFRNTPEEDSFAIATERMNGFLACAQDGTMGQVFWYLRPFEIQRIVFAELPVYRDEAAVRLVLEELLPMSASSLVGGMDSAFYDPGYRFSANPDIDQAATSNSTHSIRYGASETIMLGVSVTDQNGDVVFQNDSHGRVNPAGPLKTTDRIRVIVAKSLIDEQWYVLAVVPE